MDIQELENISSLLDHDVEIREVNKIIIELPTTR